MGVKCSERCTFAKTLVMTMIVKTSFFHNTLNYSLLSAVLVDRYDPASPTCQWPGVLGGEFPLFGHFSLLCTQFALKKNFFSLLV